MDQGFFAVGSMRFVYIVIPTSLVLLPDRDIEYILRRPINNRKIISVLDYWIQGKNMGIFMQEARI